MSDWITHSWQVDVVLHEVNAHSLEVYRLWKLTGLTHFFDWRGYTILIFASVTGPISLLILFFLFLCMLLGTMLFKKPMASSFQIGSG